MSFTKVCRAFFNTFASNKFNAEGAAQFGIKSKKQSDGNEISTSLLLFKKLGKSEVWN